MKQIRDVLQLHSVMNLSLRRIQDATRVAKSTISDYIKRFKTSGLNIEQINVLSDDELRLKLFSDQASLKNESENFCVHSLVFSLCSL